MGRKKRTSGEAVVSLVQVLEDLRGVELSREELKRQLGAFLENRAHAIPLLLRQFESEDEARLAFATSALKAMDDPTLIPALMTLLRSPDVGDLAKGLLLKLLEHYGVDTCDPSLISASIDLREVLRGPRAQQGTS